MDRAAVFEAAFTLLKAVNDLYAKYAQLELQYTELHQRHTQLLLQHTHLLLRHGALQQQHAGVQAHNAEMGERLEVLAAEAGKLAAGRDASSDSESESAE